MTPVRPTGQYRIKNPDGMEDDVQVTDGGIDMPIPESLYRNRGYQPNCDTLPWRDDSKK
ncbi:hypothetical protein [Nisaea sp.]|uniref:hypothetical protein n=1 Tax=Nisaea sp. TaxID=2024842 RepID=UPI0032EBCD69